MSTPQDPPYPMPPPPFPLHDADEPPDPDADDPTPDPRPSTAGEYTVKFTPSLDGDKRMGDFVEWLFKIDPNDSTLLKSAAAKAKADSK